jgi:hypothetical protein
VLRRRGGRDCITYEKIELLASSDCGATRKVVHSKIGVAYYTYAANFDFTLKYFRLEKENSFVSYSAK